MMLNNSFDQIQNKMLLLDQLEMTFDMLHDTQVFLHLLKVIYEYVTSSFMNEKKWNLFALH